MLAGKLKPLRLEDEATLCKYYQTRMQAVCRGFGFPAKVAAAAVLLFKRFYLSCSTLDHDPKHIMLTCVYLACKVGLCARPHLEGCSGLMHSVQLP